MTMLHLHPFGFQASSLERIRENSQLLDFEQLGAGICQSHVGKQAGKVPLLNPISSFYCVCLIPSMPMPLQPDFVHTLTGADFGVKHQ